MRSWMGWAGERRCGAIACMWGGVTGCESNTLMLEGVCVRGGCSSRDPAVFACDRVGRDPHIRPQLCAQHTGREAPTRRWRCVRVEDSFISTIICCTLLHLTQYDARTTHITNHYYYYILYLLLLQTYIYIYNISTCIYMSINEEKLALI